MDSEDLGLFSDAAHELDAQIRSMEFLAAYLCDKIGKDAAEILNELRNNKFDRDEEYEVRLSLGYHERKLLWAWARLTKLKQLRQDITRGMMKNIKGDIHD